MMGLSINILKELNMDTMEQYINKVTSIFQYNYYDSITEVPLMSFKDSILFATLAFAMKREKLNETDAEEYIAKEVGEPVIREDFRVLRIFYHQVIGHLMLCSTMELLTYIMFAEPDIRSQSEYNVGLSINRLLAELLKDEGIVYDWGFAQGQFLVQSLLCGRKQQVGGIEIDSNNYIVGKIRTRLMGIKADLQCDDLFRQRYGYSFREAAVICPPFKKDVSNLSNSALLDCGLFDVDLFWYRNESFMSRSEWPYIFKAINTLKPGGKLIALTRSAAVSSAIYSGIRQKLLELGLVECIIQLPKNLLPSNSRTVVLWIFSKKENKRVRMINALDIKTTKGRKCYLSEGNIKKIVELVKYGGDNTDIEYESSDGLDTSQSNEGHISQNIVVDMDYKDLLVYDSNLDIGLDQIDTDGGSILFNKLIKDCMPNCDLSPVRYTQERPGQKDFVENNFGGEQIFLGEVCTIKRGFVLPINEGDDSELDHDSVKYISPKHLDNGVIDILKTTSLKFDKEEVSKKPLACNSIVMSKSAPFKFGYIDDLKGKTVFGNGNTYSLMVDENEINPIYLFMYLTTELAQRQLDRIVARINPDSRTKTIAIVDLQELSIPVTSREEQDKIAAEFLKLIEKEIQIRVSLDKALNDRETLIKDVF